jgi:hypothetical protein
MKYVLLITRTKEPGPMRSGSARTSWPVHKWGLEALGHASFFDHFKTHQVAQVPDRVHVVAIKNDSM